MTLFQRTLRLRPRPRGYHIITAEIEGAIPELAGVKAGIAHIFICHTSAALTVNENADPSVRRDFRTFFDTLVPDEVDRYEHIDEGPDDMTSHIKSSLLGTSVTLPVTNGRFALGTWQGIYLCEHRDSGGERRVVVTVIAS